MQKHTKQLIAVLALLLVAAVPLGLHIANADPTDEAVASAAASSSEEQAEAPVSSSAASAADSTSVPEPQPEEEPDASSEEADSSAESGDASASSSEATASSAASSHAVSSKPAAHSAASSHAASSKPAAHSAASSHAASSSHSAASSHAASSSHASSTVSSSHASPSVSAESAVDAQIDAYVQQIYALQKRSQRQLYRAVSDSYNEYIEHPVEERNLALKVSIVLGKTVRLSQIQSECDKEFKTIIKELRRYLQDNGRDQSIADRAEKEYNTEKDAMTRELNNLTYSEVTGKGEGAKWLQDHYAEMGQ